MDTYLYSDDESCYDGLKILKNKYALACLDDFDAKATLLELSQDGLSLTWPEGKKRLQLKLDFVDGAARHRRLYGGGKSQAIAKACGFSAAYKPSILDACAGQGGDAFVFAGLGAKVILLERSAVACALLDDALNRAKAWSGEHDNELAEVVQKMHLLNESAHDYLNKAKPASVDVVYLDPMFPERKKSAQVKKNMRIFHTLIGADTDADLLLEPAKKTAKYRVVVKRPKGAPFLAEQKPTYQLDGKSTRFDIYVNKAMPG
ncbi:class I SAM-dependent methyltransferase [Agaribacterium haliotis]|uniref:class I SAM-dependent methyltransferase n=1 Tax=Agaribacterium haliotis TaxID=2013869 RepID=UPI000BB57539|nr:class I SAM-dependent methyltransferase [Agaribacterium haliotis]